MEKNSIEPPCSEVIYFWMLVKGQEHGESECFIFLLLSVPEACTWLAVSETGCSTAWGIGFIVQDWSPFLMPSCLCHKALVFLFHSRTWDKTGILPQSILRLANAQSLLVYRWTVCLLLIQGTCWNKKLAKAQPQLYQLAVSVLNYAAHPSLFSLFLSPSLSIPLSLAHVCSPPPPVSHVLQFLHTNPQVWGFCKEIWLRNMVM